MKITRAPLKRALGYLFTLSGKDGRNDQVHFHSNTVTLYQYDMVASVRLDITDLPDGATVAVPLRWLWTLVNAARFDTVDIEVIHVPAGSNRQFSDTDITVKVDGLTAKYSYSTASKRSSGTDVTPIVSRSVTVPTRKIMPALRYVRAATSRAPYDRGHLTDIVIGSDRVYATDGHRVHIAPSPWPATYSTTLCVHAVIVGVLLRAMQRCADVTFTYTEKHTTIVAGDLTVVANTKQPNSGVHSKVAALLEEKPDNMIVACRKKLVDGLIMLRKVAGVKAKDMHAVRVETNGEPVAAVVEPVEQRKVTFCIERDTAWRSDGPVLMDGLFTYTPDPSLFDRLDGGASTRVNINYLLQALTVSGSKVELHLPVSVEYNPIIVNHGDGFMAVVMPMRAYPKVYEGV